jgi:hypothetical protein
MAAESFTGSAAMGFSRNLDHYLKQSTIKISRNNVWNLKYQVLPLAI